MNAVAILPTFEAPHSRLSEVTVVGSLLMRNDGFDAIADILTPAHFYYPQLGEMFRIITQTIRDGRKADPVTLRSVFIGSAIVCPPGAGDDAVKLVTECMMAARTDMLRHIAEEIVSDASRREMIEIGRDLGARATRDRDAQPSAMIAEAQDALHRLSIGMEGTRKAKTSETAVDSLLAEIEESWRSGAYLSGLDTGYPGLNRRLRGFRKGGLYVVAARPGLGKSGLAVGLAMRMARKNGRGLFWSGEMPAEELMGRAIAAKAQIPLDVTLTGVRDYGGDTQPIPQREMDQIVRAGIEARQVPLVVDDREGATVQQILTRARRMKREKAGLAFVLVDYLGLLRGSAEVRRSGNRTAEVTEISADLARMARELEVPVVALSQLNRQSENREDRRPNLSDIRDSGAVEQDARCVIAIYREEDALLKRTGADGAVVRNLNESSDAYAKRAAEHERALEQSRGRAELIVLKNRGGRTGIVPMWFDGPTTWFRDEIEDERGEAW